MGEKRAPSFRQDEQHGRPQSEKERKSSPQYLPTKKEPEIVIIAAVAEKDRLIGAGMDLPWRIPDDLKRFKRLTTGHPLIMGRWTFDSLVHQFGGPLPNRRNIVVARSGSVDERPGVAIVSSLDVSHRIADMKIRLEAARRLAYHAAWRPRRERTVRIGPPRAFPDRLLDAL